jgi:hypothetical protein
MEELETLDMASSSSSLEFGADWLTMIGAVAAQSSG